MRERKYFGGPFVPGLWSDHILNAFKRSSMLGDSPLEPNDTWAPAGELYDEAVAWAKLLEVDVTKGRENHQEGFSGTIRISKPGRTVAVVPLCAPDVLIKHIKAYAEGNMDMGAATDSLLDMIKIGLPRVTPGK